MQDGDNATDNFFPVFQLEFVTKATKLARERKVGNQYDSGVLQGPQIDEVSQTKILAYIESAKQEGAKLETGGKRWGTAGFFVEPTVFSNVTDTMKIAREEVSDYLLRFDGRQINHQ